MIVLILYYNTNISTFPWDDDNEPYSLWQKISHCQSMCVRFSRLRAKVVPQVIVIVVPMSAVNKTFRLFDVSKCLNPVD